MYRYSWLNRIVENDDTVEKATTSYGEFVKYVNRLEARVKQSSRKDWSPERIDYAEAVKCISFFHKEICDKFGSAAMVKAINAHPFQ